MIFLSCLAVTDILIRFGYHFNNDFKCIKNFSEYSMHRKLNEEIIRKLFTNELFYNNRMF